MATRSLNVVISGDAKQLGVATKKAEGHLDGLGAKGAKMGKTLALGFGAAGAAAGGALLVGLKKSVDAAKEAEKSQARLEAQLKASGASYRAHAKEIDAVIQKHSKLAGVDDEDLQDAFTGIVRATGSVSTAMKDVGLVTDLMRARNIDAAKAGDLLAKVHNGNVGALKRMGIAIDPVTKAQDKLRDSNQKATSEQVRAAKEADKTATAQKALAELQKRVGGQAEAYGKTAAGAQDRFGVAIENLQEKIGAKLLPVVANVTNKVANFVGGMESGKGAGGRFAAAVSDGFNRAKEVVQNAIQAIRSWLNRNRDDINSVVSAFKTVAKFAKDVFQDTMLPIIKRTIKAAGEAISGIVHVIRGIVRTVSGLLSGDWDKAWDGMKEVVKGAFKAAKAVIGNSLDAIKEIIKDLGPDLVKLVGKGLLNVGKAVGTGLLKGMGSLGHLILDKVKDALSFVGDNLPGPAGFLGKVVGKAVGDGVGKTVSALPSGAGLAGGSLMGAKSIMSPFVSMAGRFGLHTSSGLRPGAITSSGNPSFHGSGNAVDEAGTPEGMLGYFRYLKSKFGRVLRELIYTPGGVGIKDGRPFRYTGQVAADHFDHVHVAYTGGAGDGVGRAPRTGDGLGEIKSLWTRAGGSSSAQNMAAAIAMAESGGNPTITHRNSDGSIDRGLWQINSVHGALSTTNRLGNAKAAVSISSNGRNWNPWTVFKTGAYKRFLSGAANADGGSGGSGGAGGSSGSSSSGFRSSQSAAKKSHTAAVTTERSLVGPGQAGNTFQGGLDVISLGRAENEGNTQETIKLVFAEMVLKRRRLEKIKRALKRRIKAETRSRLTQEAVALVADLKELSALMFDLTEGKGGAKDGMVGGPGVTLDESGNPVTDASGASLPGAGGSGSAGDAPTGPTAPDYIDAAIAEAALTPGTEDDIAAAIEKRSYAGGQLELARRSGDPRLIAQAASDFKSTIDAVDALTAATQENTKKMQESIDNLAGEIKRQTDFASSVQATDAFQMKKAFADLLSGELGGRGVARRFTPGAGVEWAF